MTFEEFKNALEKSIINGWNDEMLEGLFEETRLAGYNEGWADGYATCNEFYLYGGEDYD